MDEVVVNSVYTEDEVGSKQFMHSCSIYRNVYGNAQNLYLTQFIRIKYVYLLHPEL